MTDIITNAPDTASTAARLKAMADVRNDAPFRLRQLDVSDEHVLELLTATAALMMARRNAGVEIGLPLLEINAAILAMVQK